MRSTRALKRFGVIYSRNIHTHIYVSKLKCAIKKKKEKIIEIEIKPKLIYRHSGRTIVLNVGD